MIKVCQCENEEIVSNLLTMLPQGSKISIIMDDNNNTISIYESIQKKINSNYRIECNKKKEVSIPMLKDIESVNIPEDTRCILSIGGKGVVSITKFLAAVLDIPCACILTEYTIFSFRKEVFILDEFIDTYHTITPEIIFINEKNLLKESINDGLAELGAILLALFDAEISKNVIFQQFDIMLTKKIFKITEPLYKKIKIDENKNLLLKIFIELGYLLYENGNNSWFISGSIQAFHAYIMKNRNQNFNYGLLLLYFVKNTIIYYDKFFLNKEFKYIDPVERLDIINFLGVQTINSDKKLFVYNISSEFEFDELLYKFYKNIKQRINILLQLSYNDLNLNIHNIELFFLIAPDIDKHFTALTYAKILSQA